MGVHHLMAFSDATIIDNPRHLRAAQKRLTRAQRALSRSKWHTFVTTMLDAGVDLRDVQIAARHADPRTTQLYSDDHGDNDPQPWGKLGGRDRLQCVKGVLEQVARRPIGLVQEEVRILAGAELLQVVPDLPAPQADVRPLRRLVGLPHHEPQQCMRDRHLLLDNRHGAHHKTARTGQRMLAAHDFQPILHDLLLLRPSGWASTEHRAATPVAWPRAICGRPTAHDQPCEQASGGLSRAGEERLHHRAWSAVRSAHR